MAYLYLIWELAVKEDPEFQDKLKFIHLVWEENDWIHGRVGMQKQQHKESNVFLGRVFMKHEKPHGQNQEDGRTGKTSI